MCAGEYRFSVAAEDPQYRRARQPTLRVIGTESSCSVELRLRRIERMPALQDRGVQSHRSLRQHLSDSAIGRLQCAEGMAATIEETLTRTAEPFDELIADFAREQTWERLPRS
jgi:hypothetical protein